MIKRPTDVFPAKLIDELRRLNALSPDWIKLNPLPPDTLTPKVANYDAAASRGYQTEVLANTFLSPALTTSTDRCGIMAISRWLKEGPKIVRVTEEQYQALAHVEIPLELKEIHHPYPTILVELPPGRKHRAVLVCRYSPMVLIVSCVSYDYKDDITTVVYQHEGKYVDETLSKFDDTVGAESETTLQSDRVALNMILAMTNYGFQKELIFPKEEERDRRLANERTKRGEKAKRRLNENPVLLTLDREVSLAHQEGSRGSSDNPTGREMPPHWRRGHWARVACGKEYSQRRLILRAPTFVRIDRLLNNDPSSVTTVYRT